ncbi:glycosyltransferase family 4 protein [Candidatus Odyssella thessalonicensis]|uniref:glycosyltransferase family 4 protein n=1 Tax=Candidatus Odyssella thessalonicensis TaxID=84647 RepID=UPI000225ABED|nr:glycosyltransferase family 4 protein [Candidatus Odyssella thessalonicensis]
MRISFIISSLATGGAERVLSNLANYCSQQGHDVTIITFSTPESLPFYRLEPDIRLIPLGESNLTASPLQRLRSIFRRFNKLNKSLNLIKPDIVLSFITVSNIMAILAAARHNIPLIVSERTHPFYHFTPKFHVLLRRLLYPQAAKVIVQTQSIADYFNYLNNVAIIPNALQVPPLSKTALVSTSPRHLVSVGRLIKSKGFETLIQAFKEVAEANPDLILTIYGEGEERPRLEELIRSLNLKERVLLPGTVPDVLTRLSQADIFVFPSHYEGFPNALGEAMAVGLPVIASNCTGNIDLIKDGINGRLFPVGDAASLASLMLELLKDTEQRQRLSFHAQQTTQLLDADKIHSQWQDLILSLVKPK